MIKLSKKEAFTLVETFVFVLTLSFILAASVPLIARKHKHTPKIITHGTYVCYWDPVTKKLTEDTYNSRYLVDRQEVTSCKFKPSQNIPIYKVLLVSPGGGGVDYYKSSDFSPTSSNDYMGFRNNSRSRTFTIGTGYNNPANWSAGRSLDDGKTKSNLKMHEDDLANAFEGRIYSKCADSSTSGDAGKYCATWANTSKDKNYQEYLMKDGDNYWDYKNCMGGSHAALTAACAVALAAGGIVAVAICTVGGLIAGAVTTGLCEEAYQYDDSPKFSGISTYISTYNYPLGTTECRGLKNTTGKAYGATNSPFCVQTDISRKASSNYYGWKKYNKSTKYEQYLIDLKDKFQVTNGDDGVDASSYPYGEMGPYQIWPYLYGKTAIVGDENERSEIYDKWNDVRYYNEIYSGGKSCVPTNEGECSGGESAKMTTAGYFQGRSDQLSTERTPGLTQTVRTKEYYFNVGRKGKPGKSLSFETFEMRGECDINVHSIIPAQPRRGISTANTIPVTGTGAEIICKQGGATVLHKSVGLPDELGGRNQFETRWRGEWTDAQHNIEDVVANSFEFKSNPDYVNTGAANEDADFQGFIDEAMGSNTLWAKKDKGRYGKETPFSDFGKGGAGQIVTQNCHPEIMSRWSGSSSGWSTTVLANRGERPIHGNTNVCTSSNATVSQEAQPGGSGAVIISW